MREKESVDQLFNSALDPGVLTKEAAKLSDPQATDLAEVARTAEKKRREEAEREEARRRAIVRRWDRRMQRAFKGIFTRKERHLMLFESSKKAEAS